MWAAQARLIEAAITERAQAARLLEQALAFAGGQDMPLRLLSADPALAGAVLANGEQVPLPMADGRWLCLLHPPPPALAGSPNGGRPQH